jgi:hypothetical protein
MATLGVNFFDNRLYFAMEEGESETAEAVVDVDVVVDEADFLPTSVLVENLGSNVQRLAR